MIDMFYKRVDGRRYYFMVRQSKTNSYHISPAILNCNCSGRILNMDYIPLSKWFNDLVE